MATEFTNRARNTGSGAYVYWVTTGAGDPSMTGTGAPNPANHTDSVVVGKRFVEGDAAAADPNFQIAVATRHVLIAGSILSVTYATSRTP